MKNDCTTARKNERKESYSLQTSKQRRMKHRKRYRMKEPADKEREIGYGNLHKLSAWSHMEYMQVSLYSIAFFSLEQKRN